MIYVVRHGKTDWNEIGRYQGRKNIKLNSEGREQARIVKDKLKSVKFDVVISSPLKRAYETATIINGKDNIIIDERIIERSNGALEGKLKSEITEKIDFNDPNEKKYGIESIKDFRKRIKLFCEDLLKKYKNKNVLIITHAGVGIYIRCFFEGEPKNADYSKYKIGNCEIIKYDI